MRADHDGMMLVRAELCDRLDSLQKAAGRMAVRDFVQGIGAIRTMAAAYGLIPVVCLADALERADRAPSRAAARPASISTGCATRSAAPGSTKPPARRCSPRSRSAWALRDSHFFRSRRPRRPRRPYPKKVTVPIPAITISAMDALLTAFVAAFLAEWGDKTQLVVAMLAATTGKPGRGRSPASLSPRLASNVVAAYRRRLHRRHHHHPRDDPDGRARLALRRRLRPDPPEAARPVGAQAPAPSSPPSSSASPPKSATAPNSSPSRWPAASTAPRWPRPARPRACSRPACRRRCSARGSRAAVPMRAIRYGVAALFLIAGFIVAVKALQLA